MKWTVVTLFLLALVNGCFPSDKPPSGTGVSGSPEKDVLRAGPEKTTDLDIGDAEQTIFLNIRVAPKSEAGNVKVIAKADTMQRCRMMIVNVSAPFPKEMWLETVVSCRSNFGNCPVVIRGSYQMDEKKEIAPFTLVLGKESQQERVLPAIDVLAGREEVPDTMLVTLSLEGLLMPAGTDEASIDPGTATTAKDRISRAMMSTTVRLNFIKEGAPLPETVPVHETEDERDSISLEGLPSAPAPEQSAAQP